MPSAAVGSGRFGIRASSSSRSLAAWASSSLAVASSAASRRSWPISSGPGLLLDSFFWAARRVSARSVASRHRASAASSASKSFAAPRRASAARYRSGSCRADLRSITWASLVGRQRGGGAVYGWLTDAEGLSSRSGSGIAPRRWPERVASTEPPRISANAPAIDGVNRSPSTETPSVTATAGLT